MRLHEELVRPTYVRAQTSGQSENLHLTNYTAIDGHVSDNHLSLYLRNIDRSVVCCQIRGG